MTRRARATNGIDFVRPQRDEQDQSPNRDATVLGLDPSVPDAGNGSHPPGPDRQWDDIVERGGGGRAPGSSVPPPPQPAIEPSTEAADGSLVEQVASMRKEIAQLRKLVEALIRWGRQVDSELAGTRVPPRPSRSHRDLAPTDDWLR